jgi:hypothetical protein
MPINKFSGAKFTEKRDKFDPVLFDIQRLWPCLSPWQRKKIFFRCVLEVVRVRTVKRLQAVPAVIGSAWLSWRAGVPGLPWVIVPAVYRAGMGAAGVCDLLSASGMNVIYSLLFLLIFFSG